MKTSFWKSCWFWESWERVFDRMMVNRIGKDFTTTRRVRRQSGVLKARFSGPIFRLALLAGLLGAPQFASAQGIRMNEDIVADPITGAAILGFDPISYFVDRRAALGSPDHQAIFGGKVWYFASSANKSVFETNPGLYLPAFGGHDPVAIAAGIPLSGRPSHFLVDGERIFLFRSRESREAFIRDPGIKNTAEKNWPQVKRELIP